MRKKAKRPGNGIFLKLMDPRRAFGNRAEETAAHFLAERGMDIVARQYHTRFGEIDIVVWDGQAVRFVEVKARTSEAFGSPEEAVTKSKIRKIAAAAELFLTHHGWQDRAWQIDVLALTLLPHTTPDIRHIENVGFF